MKSSIPQIKDYIDSNIDEVNCITDIVELFGINRIVLHERFKIEYGQGPKEYILNRKLDRLIAVLNELGINEINYYYAREIGFSSGSALSNFIKRKTGMTFHEFKENAMRNRQLYK